MSVITLRNIKKNFGELVVPVDPSGWGKRATMRIIAGLEDVTSGKMLMDEPLSHPDAKLRIEMRAEIVKLCRRLKVATFYVTHNQPDPVSERSLIAPDRISAAQQGEAA